MVLSFSELLKRQRYISTLPVVDKRPFLLRINDRGFWKYSLFTTGHIALN